MSICLFDLNTKPFSFIWSRSSSYTRKRARWLLVGSSVPVVSQSDLHNDEVPRLRLPHTGRYRHYPYTLRTRDREIVEYVCVQG